MTSITTRETSGGGATVKGLPLTNAEIDNNFISLTTSKLEASQNLGDLTDTDVAKSNLDLASMSSQESNNVTITGGSISGVQLTTSDATITGGSISGVQLTTSDATITGGSISGVTLSSSSIDFNGGTIDGATISNSTINNDVNGTATNVSSSLSAGDGLNGSDYDGSSSVTFTVDGSVIRDVGDQTVSGTFKVDSLGVNTAASGSNGDIRATGDIIAHYSSDINNKENIKDITNALSIVNAVGGKTFDWKDDYINSKGGEDSYFMKKSDFGVIAQDLQDVFPLAVKERENGELAVDYVKLCAIAFAAIKELNEKINKNES